MDLARWDFGKLPALVAQSLKSQRLMAIRKIRLKLLSKLLPPLQLALMSVTQLSVNLLWSLTRLDFCFQDGVRCTAGSREASRLTVLSALVGLPNVSLACGKEVFLVIDHYVANKTDDVRWIGCVSQCALKGIIERPILLVYWTLPGDGLSLEKLASELIESAVIHPDNVARLEFLRLPQEVKREVLEERPFFIF